MAAWTLGLNAVAERWVAAAWMVVWQSTLLVGAAALVAALALRRASPALRFWIWQILAIKLLLMPFWTQLVPLPQSTTEAESEPAAGASAPGRVEVGARTPGFDGPREAVVSAESDVPVLLQERVYAPIAPQVSWQGWLLLAWGTIVLAHGLRWIWQRVRLTRLLREALPADGLLLDEVREAAREIGLAQAPRTLVMARECSPFVCGVRRPVLVVPGELWPVLSSAERRFILLHELAHIRRRDLAWGWIGELVRALYFFHPVAHWLSYRLRLERELACDQWALGISGQGPAEYAATLLRVVAHGMKPSLLQPAAMSAGGHPQLSTFWKRRLAMLPSLSHSALRPSRRALLTVALLGLAALSVPTVRLVSGLSAAPPGEGGNGVADSAGTAFSDWLAFADGGEKRAAGDTERGDGAPEFLPRPSKDEERIVQALEKPTTVDFQETALEDALVFLHNFHDIPIWVDKSSLEEQGVALDGMVSAKLDNARLESVLRLLLKPLQLDFLVEDDVLKITTATTAADTLFTRTYPVRDLYDGRQKVKKEKEKEKEQGAEKGEEKAKGDAEKPARSQTRPPKFDDLLAALTETIEPDSWEDLSGPGTLTYVSETGALVIQQSWSVHRKIVQLLRDLREAKRLSERQKREPHKTN